MNTRLKQKLKGLALRSAPLALATAALGLSPAWAAPRIYVFYVIEPRLSKFFLPAQSINGCVWARKGSISVRSDSTSSVDEAGGRFNCKNSYWYDLTCQGDNKPAREPASQRVDLATILLDVSQSMRSYDPVKNGRCHRADLLRALKQARASVRVYGHAESLQQMIRLEATDHDLARQACQTSGDNATTRVFQQALPIHGDSRQPLIMITDMSEQTPSLKSFVKAHGAREFFVRPDELASRVLALVR